MDLVVGASIIAALLILVCGVLWLKESLSAKKMVLYTFLFPNVGTLQVGDPVMANGVTKGRVKDISLRGSQVAAVVSLEKDVALTDSCSVRVQNIGLMGERGIGILLSRAGERRAPSHKRDTTFFTGGFDTGIAEAMGMMGTVLSQVETLLTNVSGILNSTVGDSSFIHLFPLLTGRLDTLTRLADNIIKKNGPLINNSISNLSKSSSQLKELLDRNTGHIDAILANGDQLSAYALTLMQKVESLSASIQGIVKEIENGEGAAGMLIKDKQFSTDLKRTISDVDTLVNAIQNDALKLRIKLGFGKKKK